jgi:menaquinol-cytochrome c reductase cytochrome b subunit
VRVFKSIHEWIDERAGMHHYIKREILDKPVPKGLNLSFCFGGITFFLFLMLAASGYIMTIYYVPSPEQAYQTVDYITHEVSLGYVIRGVHYWAANLMIVTVLLHMIRVFIYGAYKKPRELNWITGVLLLLLILAFGFTGYLLPWDQKAYWATNVGTSIVGTVPFIGEYVMKIVRGGTDLGALTLLRFYSLHVIFLPMAAVILLVGHFFMIRRHGVSTPL